MNHTIRLHGPWYVLAVLEAENGAAQDDAAFETRIQMPGQWLDWFSRNESSTTILKRDFGRPTGLDPDQQVWLVIDSDFAELSVSLNDQRLENHQPSPTEFRCAIGNLLLARNSLRIDIMQVKRGSNGLLIDADNRISGIRLEIVDAR